MTRRALQVAFLAVLARILGPAEFGVIAAATVVVSFVTQLSQLGVAPTLIQAPDLDDRTVSVARTIVLGAAFALLILTEIFGPLAGAWFRNPDVTDVLRALAVTVVAQAVSIIPHAILTRRLKARELSLVELGCDLIGTGLIAIPLALMGWSYWALAFGAIIQAFAKAIILILMVRLPRLFVFDWVEAKRLWFMGAGFSLTVLLHRIALECDRLVVGRYLSAADLGLYSRANGLMVFPASFYGALVDRVAFPAFAQIHADADRIRQAYLHAVGLTAIIGVPMTAFLIITGPDIIELVLGPRWLGAVVAFEILSAAMYFRLSDRISGSLLRGMGRPYLMARVQGVIGLVALVGSLWAVRFGIAGVAAAVVVAAMVSYALLTTHAIRLARVDFGRFATAQAHGLALGLLVALAAGGMVWVTHDQPPFLTLLAAASASAGAAALGVTIAPRLLLGAPGKALIAALPSFLQRLAWFKV